MVARFWEKVAQRGPDECWAWKAGLSPSGYGKFWDAGRTVRSHRVAWELESGQSVPDGMMVLHTCDNRPCCNPAHLYVGSHEDNMRDRVERDRGVRGTRHHNAKLRPDQAETIRELYATGRYTHRSIALAYGVSKKAVQRIVWGLTWKVTA